MRPLALLSSLLLLPSAGPTLLAQQPFSQLSASELLHAYVQHATSRVDGPQLYTYLILHRDQNFLHGKLTGDQAYLSELIYIGGLPYIHRLEHNGKPLRGKELDRENKLYNETLQERTGLTDDVRRKLLHEKSSTVQAFPLDQLESQFHPEITGHPVFDGHPSILLDLTPLHPDAPPTLQRHILLTLDAGSLNLLQSHVELLAPDNGFSKGTVIDNRLTCFDGTLLPAATSIDTTIAVKHLLWTEDLHLIGTDTFSHYRRFTTTVTLKPASDPNVPSPPSS